MTTTMDALKKLAAGPHGSRLLDQLTREAAEMDRAAKKRVDRAAAIDAGRRRRDLLPTLRERVATAETALTKATETYRAAENARNNASHELYRLENDTRSEIERLEREQVNSCAPEISACLDFLADLRARANSIASQFLRTDI